MPHGKFSYNEEASCTHAQKKETDCNEKWERGPTFASAIGHLLLVGMILEIGRPTIPDEQVCTIIPQHMWTFGMHEAKELEHPHAKQKLLRWTDSIFPHVKVQHYKS